jgi:hypothetical protein
VEKPTEDGQICWQYWHSGVIGERKEVSVYQH